MICTYKDCDNKASREFKDKDNKAWCNVCREHFNLYVYISSQRCIDEKGTGWVAKKQISFWIKANGGAKSLTNKILGKEQKW
jgi:hypothetical protein